MPLLWLRRDKRAICGLGGGKVGTDLESLFLLPCLRNNLHPPPSSFCFLPTSFGVYSLKLEQSHFFCCIAKKQKSLLPLFLSHFLCWDRLEVTFSIFFSCIAIFVLKAQKTPSLPILFAPFGVYSFKGSN